jgi:hypothetical protein
MSPWFRSKSLASSLLTLLIAALSGCGLQRVKYSEPEKIAGQINWVVREGDTGNYIDSGTMTVLVRDVKVQKVIGIDIDKTPFFEKRVDLNKDFYFVLPEFSFDAPPDDKEGFALSIIDRDLDTFCWELFDVDGNRHAIKRQETGELAFDTKKIGAKWEISRTEFLTDVEFRLRIHDSNGKPESLKWRVTIQKGSYMNWPSLVSDTISLNN